LEALDPHLVLDKLRRHVACSICVADPAHNFNGFCVNLPGRLDACEGVKNRCQEHVGGQRHRHDATRGKKQTTLRFAPADPEAQSR
jgi:hypothetical protein